MPKTSRRTFLRIAPAAAALSAVGSAVDGAPGPSLSTIWYQQPAGKWEEALAIGNGRLGAMIFGGIEKERAPAQRDHHLVRPAGTRGGQPEAYKGLPGIRQLIKEGKYQEANKAMNEQRTCLKEGRAGVGTYGSYQTLGDLNLEFAPLGGTPTAYRRWLDIDEAVAGVTYKVGEDVWTRELFSSGPSQVIVMRIACTRKGAVGFDARLSRVQWAETKQTGPDTLTMTGTSTGQPGDLRYEAQVHVRTKGGTVSAAGDRITVKDADEATIFVVLSVAGRAPDLVW